MATVFNPSTKKDWKVCAFFDSGSTGTFVRKEVAQQLGLPNFGNEPLHLDTFAQDKPVRLDTFRTQIGFRQIDGTSLVLDLKASPKLVPPLEAVFIKPSDEALLRRNQCDLVPQHIVPDILIGRNHRHLFRPDELRPPLPNGFTLLRTTLGTILTGSGQFKQRSSDLTTSPCRRYVSSETDSTTAPSKVVRFTDAPSTTPNAGAASSETTYHGSSDPPDGRSPAQARAKTAHLSVFFTHLHRKTPLKAMSNHFWHTENIGIAQHAPLSDDEIVRERIRKGICLAQDDDKRYQIRLPWKTKDGEPPSTRDLPIQLDLALSRLDSFRREHLHHPEALQAYDDGLRQMAADGEIEKFNPKDQTSGLLHLFIHHASFRAGTSVPKQALFDGSAKLVGLPSVNDFLHENPPVLPTMVSILLRTRLHSHVVVANIAHCLRRVSLHPRDRSACAFVWLKDPTSTPRKDNLVFYRFKRVPAGLKSSSLLLGATMQFHLEHQGPLASEIWRNYFQGSIVFSADSLDEAIRKYRGTKDLFASAKMDVLQFTSNSNEFNKQMPPADLASPDHLWKLGYTWNVETDAWHVSFAPRPDERPSRKRRVPKNDVSYLTKRKMMYQLVRIVDPLGLTAPALVAAKLAVQESFKIPLKWDDPLGSDFETIWSHATKDFESTTIEIPRHICAGPVSSLELHICVDASQDAYGFASYIRVPLDDVGTKFDVSLVFSRCKVKPISADEKLTISRMELMAMALGCRNALFLKEQLFDKTITRVTIWSDSMVVLQQLRNPAKPKEQFVENRLKEIRALQQQLHFDTRYVHTSENPGDIIFRGIRAADLQTCELWWKGIPFLRQSESEWPAQPEPLLHVLPGPSGPATAEVASVFVAYFSDLEICSESPTISAASDDQHLKDRTAPSSDKQPPPPNTAATTDGESVERPALAHPSRRRVFITTAQLGSRAAGGLPSISTGGIRSPPSSISEHNATGHLSVGGSGRHAATNADDQVSHNLGNSEKPSGLTPPNKEEVVATSEPSGSISQSRAPHANSSCSQKLRSHQEHRQAEEHYSRPSTTPRRVTVQLNDARLLRPSGRQQVTSLQPTTDQPEPTMPLLIDESQPSTQTQDNCEASSDAIGQAAHNTASNDSLNESSAEDEVESLIEADEKSQLPDSYAGLSYGNDLL